MTTPLRERISTQKDSLRHRLTKESKPLPSTPQMEKQGSKPLPPKPLPELPSDELNPRQHFKTLLYLGAIVIWFLAIVLLLPIVTEKNHMPRLNKLLRELFSGR